jgi:aspartyl protease family protein
MRSNRWLWYLVGLALVGIVVLLLANRFPGRLDDDAQMRRLVTLGGWLALVASGALIYMRARPKAAFGQLGIWVGIILVLVLGYSFRDDAAAVWSRLAGALNPAQGEAGPAGSVVFRKSDDGHFHVEAEVEGTRIRFIVDTGASSIVLSPADALRLGFDLAKLDYTVPTMTANGEGRSAPVELRTLAVGSIRLEQVRALVNEAPMDGSLLGMSFLARLGGFAVEGDRLVLKP